MSMMFLGEEWYSSKGSTNVHTQPHPLPFDHCAIELWVEEDVLHLSNLGSRAYAVCLVGKSACGSLKSGHCLFIYLFILAKVL